MKRMRANDICTGLGNDDALAWKMMRDDPLKWQKQLETWAAYTEENSRYRFRAKAGGEGEILLYGPIGRDYFGDGIGAQKFAQELRKLDGKTNITVRIDSPGGSVPEAQAIYSLLRQHPANIDVKVDGFAASAASVIMMAGDTISIPETSMVMIHDARGVAIGTAEAMDKASSILRAISDNMAGLYAARTGVKKNRIVDWMKAETWFNGTDAVKNGFADKLIPSKKAAETKVSAYAEAFGNFPQSRRSARELVATLERMTV